MLLKRLTVVTLAALTLACGGDERPVLKVGADGTSFQREAVPSTGSSAVIANVPYITWNRGGATAFVRTCGGRPLPALEWLVNGSWEPYPGPFCIVLMPEPQIELRAGQTRRDQIAIGDAGRFRIRMPYASDAQWSKNLYTTSAPFDVR